jgi:hypothetical protein
MAKEWEKRNVDWTNSKKWGYVGTNTKRTNRYIKGKDVLFRILKKEGFKDTITYYDLEIMAEKQLFSFPRWFTNFKNKDGVNPYLISGKGTKSVYRLPTFDAVSEVMDIYLLIDDLPREHLLKLPKKQHDVVLLRYGINDGIVRTFEEVAKIVGHSSSYCWRLNQKALLKLEEYSGTKISINITPLSREKY